MKRTFTFTVLLLLLQTAMAQRVIDLQITLTSPQNHSLITARQGVDFITSVKNVGTTALEATDTLKVAYIVDGDSMTFVDGGAVQRYFTVTGNAIGINDSVSVTKRIAFDTSMVGETIDFCVAMEPFNAADGIMDDDIGNNQSCISLHIEAPLSVQENTDREAISIYPNPARDQFSIQCSEAITYTGITDVTGRLVAADRSGTSSVDCSLLARGVYFVTIKTAGQVYTQRLLIHK